MKISFLEDIIIFIYDISTFCCRFVGDMDRDQANMSMQLYPMGTFLVRARLQAGERVGYALSLRTKEVGIELLRFQYLFA